MKSTGVCLLAALLISAGVNAQVDTTGRDTTMRNRRDTTMKHDSSSYSHKEIRNATNVPGLALLLETPVGDLADRREAAWNKKPEIEA